MFSKQLRNCLETLLQGLNNELVKKAILILGESER